MKEKTKEKVGILFTGGKDSCLALHKYGKEKVNCLLSIIPENEDSFMFHCPDLRLLKKQAEMLNLLLIIEKTNGEEEKELEDLKKLIRKSKAERVVIGGIASNYQGRRIRKICKELGVEVETPLWNYTAEKLWKELLEEGFKVIIVKITSEGIPKEFIGKIVDKEKLDKYAETAVLFMPEFKEEIRLRYSVKSEGAYRHFLKINEIR